MAERTLCEAGALLDAWIDAHGLSREEFADLLGCRREVLFRWLVGDAVPHIDSLAEIERITKGEGQVKATMWARPRTGTGG